MKRKYKTGINCPRCGEPQLEQRTSAAGELIGVSCACGHEAALKPFPLPGAVGYFVGDDGRAYSVHRGLRHIKPKINRGFPRVRVIVTGVTYWPYLAPAVLTAFRSRRPPGMDALHKDGDVRNCAIDNLQWALVRARQTTAEQFVRAWQSAGSVQEVADMLGCEYGSVAGRALRLRQHGVPLKSFVGHRGEKLDWDALAKLAAECGDEPTTP